jgi:hypothetical protein
VASGLQSVVDAPEALLCGVGDAVNAFNLLAVRVSSYGAIGIAHFITT